MPPPKQHVLQAVANDLASWMESMPGKLAGDFLTDVPPWGKPVTQDQAAEFWRWKLFDKDGTPKVGDLADFVGTYGAGALKKTVAELNKRNLLAYPEDKLPGQQAEEMPAPEPQMMAGVMSNPGQDPLKPGDPAPGDVEGLSQEHLDLSNVQGSNTPPGAMGAP